MSSEYVREYLRDYVLGIYDLNTTIYIEQTVQQAIKHGLFTQIDWRDTFTYLCAPMEKPVCVDMVLSILSVFFDKENERFISQYCEVKPDSDTGYLYMARLASMEEYT